MRVLIHAGRHKTGTSSIQAFLAANEGTLLRNHGIWYPREGRDARHHFHHPLFREILDKNGALSRGIAQSIMDRASSIGCHTVLLSSELLSRTGLKRNHYELVQQAFSQCELNIVLYLRNQADFLESMYANRIRIGLLRAPDRINELKIHLDYYAFVSRFSEVFGKDSMIIRSYDDAVVHGLFADFLKTIGVSAAAEINLDQERLNERLPWRYVALLRYANRQAWLRRLLLHRRARNTATRLQRVAPGFMNAPRPLSNDQREAIKRSYQPSNDRLAQEYLGQRHLFGTEVACSPSRH